MAATGSRRIRLFLTPIVGLSYFLFASFFVILSFFCDKFFGFPDILPTPFNIIFSVPLMLIGLFLMFWSVFHFIKVKGTPVPFNPPPKLVDSGPYAYIRNPMLSGIFLFLFGIGLVYGSISLVFIFTPLFILINVIELKTIEEPELEKRLGQEYLEYRKKTPMFFSYNKL
ncbi:methyltransferase family protein [Thermodesulfobacteriota bacterium]